MFYIITEIQKNGEQITAVSTVYTDEPEAKSAFYSKAAYVPITEADVMTITIVKGTGEMILAPVTGGKNR